LLHVLLGFAALQASLAGLGLVIELSAALAPVAVLALLVPALTYAFLTTLWIMRLFAGALKGLT
jgi:hypothetical protein